MRLPQHLSGALAISLPTPSASASPRAKPCCGGAPILERAGGIETLAKEVAEDAAATKIVRGAGLKVRLVDRPFPQPLGYRTAAEVWHRQVRWARLRRASFFAYFLPEAVSGGVLPMIALAVVAPAVGLPAGAERGCLRRSFGTAARRSWPRSPAGTSRRVIRSSVCSRDALLPVLFVSALQGDDFVWRGNEMQVERLRPRGMMARMRPRACGSGAARAGGGFAHCASGCPDKRRRPVLTR